MVVVVVVIFAVVVVVVVVVVCQYCNVLFQEAGVNGQDTVNGFTAEPLIKTEIATVVTGDTNSNGVNDDDDDDDLKVTGCQPTAANNVYDLHVHNQTRLWKALPKPSNTSQVSFHY